MGLGSGCASNVTTDWLGVGLTTDGGLAPRNGVRDAREDGGGSEWRSGELDFSEGSRPRSAAQASNPSSPPLYVCTTPTPLHSHSLLSLSLSPTHRTEAGGRGGG
jgi:hypothetical protein